MHNRDYRFITRAWELCALAETTECTLMESVLRLCAAEDAPFLWLHLASVRRAERMLRSFFREGDRKAFALAVELWRRALEKHI